MAQNNDQFDLSLDSEYDEFDPLADAGEDNDAEGEGGEYLPTATAAETAAQAQDAAPAAVDERPASERIADLFKSMAPRRKVLLGILAFCQEPQAVADVNAEVDRLQADNFSVYTAANLCTLLERAGAIERVDAEGAPAEELEAEPEVVVVDGVEYLQASEPAPTFWVLTEPGREALEADQPLERLHALLDDDARYAVIYKRILTVCAAEGGATTPAINERVDNDPLVQKPRLYAPHFVDKLEKCDALEWRKAWYTTEIGRAGLEMLADVADESADQDEKEN